ncbi:MAG: DUF2848 domain-containing protein [Pseudorhodoplanes sp.]
MVESRGGTGPLTAAIEDLVICGWAGRDKAATEHHIGELEALGVKRPTSTPIYYRVAAARLTADPVIEDVGANSSGEVETVLLSCSGGLYVGVGSDHTDRQVETYGVSISKQVCDKPLAATVWPYEEVADHWDSLVLRSFAVIEGKRRKYQEGAVSELLPPADLLRGLNEAGELPEGTALFGGTVPAIGGVQMASRFEGELEDPVLKRVIRFGYDLKILPIRT